MLSLEILWGNKAAHFRIQEIGSNQTSQMESILMCSVFRTNFRIKTSDNKRRLNPELTFNNFIYDIHKK